ncbi:MAG TPA: hypothetical protein VIN08_12305 [Ohtaekwangia sp.]|uniref:hypothetical protein n=1 Tax=Ohtaekwangia sp. TaxID=2066019 RepID=UPI002F91CE43
MKYFIILFVILSGCKSQKDQYTIKEKEGYTLPAHQLDKSEEESLLNSIRNSRTNADFQEVIINNKAYSPKEFLSIVDTLGSNYTFNVRIDSLQKSKVLVITKKP